MFSDRLEELRLNNLIRRLMTRNSPQGPVIRIQNADYINFASNDYLGLSGHYDICLSAKNAVDEYAFGSGSSRLLGGGCSIHDRLEEKVSLFKGTESALILNSGYSANTGIIPALCTDKDAIFSDEFNHASIIDGCRLSRAETFIFRHRDPVHLEELLSKCQARQKIVVTDSVFSMDGDIAPLDRIHELCRKYNALLYLDDAHGTGVLGKGKGTLHEFGLSPEPWILQMGTFSKALGAFGAFVAGQRDAIAWIVNSCRSFMFSTALPPAVVAACLAALGLLEKESWRQENLRNNASKLYSGLKDLGFEVMGGGTPIVPVNTFSIEAGLVFSDYLFRNGIYAPLIRPPSVPSPRIRLTVTALHTENHLNRIFDCFSSSPVRLSG